MFLFTVQWDYYPHNNIGALLLAVLALLCSRVQALLFFRREQRINSPARESGRNTTTTRSVRVFINKVVNEYSGVSRECEQFDKIEGIGDCYYRNTGY